HRSGELVAALPPARAAALLGLMADDRATDIVHELDEEERARLIPLLGTDAFQELDVFGLTMPIVKHSWLVRSVDDLPRVVADAFRIAREGRPGPVLIDLPKDVQLADASHLP
ncbi:magnesium transporter MgtE N-terminal domain-containing protein, partial [Enterobacter hormaechei]|uniref:magnesium transporter MgtE N-terminal domain-containing protein n=1 Tax=Enterobacter hormaechei TaxID=158836 RepID=UPI00203BDADF